MRAFLKIKNNLVQNNLFFVK